LSAKDRREAVLLHALLQISGGIPVGSVNALPFCQEVTAAIVPPGCLQNRLLALGCIG